MSGNSGKIEWYLARDGQQHGPLSAVELDKFIELGHLRPTDLLWRAGFDDWRTATEVFPPLPPKAQAAPPVQSSPTGAAGPAQQRIQPASDGGHVGASQNPTVRPAGRTDFGAGAGAMSEPANTQFTGAAAQSPERGHQSAAGPASPADLVEPARHEPSHAAPDATTLRPGRAGQEPALAAEAGPGSGREAGDDEFDDDEFFEEEEEGRSGWLMVAAALFLFVMIGAGGLFAYNNQREIVAMYSDLMGRAVPSASSTDIAVVRRPDQPTGEPAGNGASQPVKPATLAIAPRPEQVPQPQSPTQPQVAPQPPADAPPAAASRGLTDLPILRSKLWQFAQQEFGEWTRKRLAELAEQDKSREEATQHLVQAFVKFRRENAGVALSASSTSLKEVASAFVDSLRALTAKDANTCYAYISNGETTPEVAPLFFEPDIGPKLEAQMLAIMKAVADGRSAPTARRQQPSNKDFDKLSAELGRRGWSDADLKLFSDPNALAKAEPKLVCRLVTEWFATQAALKDATMRDQLIAASLRPVIGG